MTRTQAHTQSLAFGHTPNQIAFWRRLVRPLLGAQHTPFYLFSVVPAQRALATLQSAFAPLPIRHWLSCKTQPLQPWWRWCRQRGLGAEVVSPFELRAAIQEGFPPHRILINGPAKHHWLPPYACPRLLVNFDSFSEAQALVTLARKHHWTCGIRLLTSEEFDPESPQYPTQFGMDSAEAAATLRLLQHHDLAPEILHFHLRTNVPSHTVYARAVERAAAFCRANRFRPAVLDCGGGFPPPHIQDRQGRFVDRAFDLASIRSVYEKAFHQFPSVRELWLENGRYLTARSGVLVVGVRDTKQRRRMRYLLCDGGRTLHALVANWEQHQLLCLPHRSGPLAHTTVVGPTCMAFDQLARRPLPENLRPGDHLVWLDAGAYHLPWETRFSHGLASILWHDGRRVRTHRPPESFDSWWRK